MPTLDDLLTRLREAGAPAWEIGLVAIGATGWPIVRGLLGRVRELARGDALDRAQAAVGKATELLFDRMQGEITRTEVKADKAQALAEDCERRHDACEDRVRKLEDSMRALTRQVNQGQVQ